MQLGRVIGTLVATKKHGKLEGAKLLIVQPLTLDDRPRGTAVLTIDSVGAGVGEKVLIVIEGRAAGDALRRRAAPVDAAIIGIVDHVTIEEEPRVSFSGQQGENETRDLQTPKRPKGARSRRS
jgi:microcompartment protein CcmK/EutM